MHHALSCSTIGQENHKLCPLYIIDINYYYYNHTAKKLRIVLDMSASTAPWKVSWYLPINNSLLFIAAPSGARPLIMTLSLSALSLHSPWVLQLSACPGTMPSTDSSQLILDRLSQTCPEGLRWRTISFRASHSFRFDCECDTEADCPAHLHVWWCSLVRSDFKEWFSGTQSLLECRSHKLEVLVQRAARWRPWCNLDLPTLHSSVSRSHMSP